MKERILFVGVGQAGSNIANLFERKGYLSLYINTSNDDLDSIDSGDEFKYHIPTGMGCSKMRSKGLKFAMNYHTHIENMIDSKFPRQDIVFFIFSLGGGTGSGISPVILDCLSRINPHKNYGAMIIIPSISESIQTQRNAIEAFNDLLLIENLKNLYQLDNNELDRFEVNQRFVELFDRLLNITIADRRGVIDKAELEKILTSKGNVLLSYLNTEKISDSFSSTIFSPFKKGCELIALSLTNDKLVDYYSLENILGTPIDKFIGYNPENNFIAVAGMPNNTKRMEQLRNTVIMKQNDRDTNKNTIIPIEVPEASISAIKPMNFDKKVVNYDEIFAKFSTKK